MRKSIYTLYIIVAILLFASCEHKDLCYKHPHTTKVRIDVDWSKFTKYEIPTGMTVMLYPKYSGTAAISHLTNTTSHAIVNLPADRYHTLVFNQSTSEFGSILFRGLDKKETAEVVTNEHKSRWYSVRNDYEKVATDPEWVGVGNYSNVEVTQQMIDADVAATMNGNGVTRSGERSIATITPVNAVQEPVVVQQPIVKPEAKPFYMALKTNALYDVLAIPNIGVEFYLGKKWSVATNWHYAWWKTDPKHWYWRTYGGDIALRRWFGRKAAEKPLTGHHVGVYGQILTYDFETGGRGYLGDRWSYAAGVEYGYSLPIAKRLNIDFTLGMGYLRGEYKEYLPMDECYVWQATKNRKWLGPTKAEVSLVWLLGSGNSNKIRGGKR